MGYYDTFEKPYKDRRASPAMSIYLISEDSKTGIMEKLHCIWCKRIISDLKGQVDKIISTPVSVADFEIGVNIRCKLCHQNYRLLVNAV